MAVTLVAVKLVALIRYLSATKVTATTLLKIFN